MPPAVGGGIRYMTVGGVVGAGCIPLPVPETHSDLYKTALRRELFTVGRVRYVRRNRYNFDERSFLNAVDTGNRELYVSLRTST